MTWRAFCESLLASNLIFTSTGAFPAFTARLCRRLGLEFWTPSSSSFLEIKGPENPGGRGEVIPGRLGNPNPGKPNPGKPNGNGKNGVNGLNGVVGGAVVGTGTGKLGNEGTVEAGGNVGPDITVGGGAVTKPGNGTGTVGKPGNGLTGKPGKGAGANPGGKVGGTPIGCLPEVASVFSTVSEVADRGRAILSAFFARRVPIGAAMLAGKAVKATSSKTMNLGLNMLGVEVWFVAHTCMTAHESWIRERGKIGLEIVDKGAVSIRLIYISSLTTTTSIALHKGWCGFSKIVGIQWYVILLEKRPSFKSWCSTVAIEMRPPSCLNAQSTA